MDSDSATRGRLLAAGRRCSRRATLRAGVAGLATAAVVAAAPRATPAQAATPAAAPVAASAVAGHVFVDPPLGGYAQELTVTLEQNADGGPRLVLTEQADPGEADLLYAYEFLAAATAAPSSD
jgi:hypothetical protein